VKEEETETESSSSVLSSTVVLKLFSALGTVTKEALGLKNGCSGLAGEEKRALMSLGHLEMRDWLEVDVGGRLQRLNFDPYVSMAWQSEEGLLGGGQVDTLRPIGRLCPRFSFKPELQPLA